MLPRMMLDCLRGGFLRAQARACCLDHDTPLDMDLLLVLRMWRHSVIREPPSDSDGERPRFINGRVVSPQHQWDVGCRIYVTAVPNVFCTWRTEAEWRADWRDVVYLQCGVHLQRPPAAYPRCGHCDGLFKGGSVTATCPLHPECSIGLLHHNCVRLHMERCHPDHDTRRDSAWIHSCWPNRVSGRSTTPIRPAGSWRRNGAA